MLTRQQELSLIAGYQNANNKEDQQEAERLFKDAYRNRVNDTIQDYLGSPSLPGDDWFAQTLGEQLGGKRPSEELSDSAWQGFFEVVTDFDLAGKRDFWPEARQKILLRLDLDLIAGYQDKNDTFGRNLAVLLLMKAYRKKIRYQAWRFSPHSTELNQELVEQAAESGFWEAVERFDLTRGNRLWTYANRWVQRRLIEYVAKTMGLSDDGRRVYRIVRVTQKRLEEELGRKPTLTLVADEVVATYPNKRGWRENRLGKAVKNVLDGLNRCQIPLDLGDENGENGMNSVLGGTEEPVTPLLLSQERLHQRYHQARAALRSEAYAQKFLVLLVLRHLGEYQWPEIADRLTEPPNRIFSVWTVICNDFALSGMIPCDWEKVCKCFSQTTLTSDALRVSHTRAQKQIRRHHFRTFCERVVEGLGDTAGSKWPILFLLHKGKETDYYWHKMAYQVFDLCQLKETNYTWDEMAPLLSTCSQEVAKPWQRTFNYLFFNKRNPPIPKKWSAVCALFSSPPPNQTPTELEKWYSEQIETLRQAL
jgi:hypothetical protein